MGVTALDKVGKLACIALAVAGTASVPEPLRASPPIKMLPDQLCGPSVPGVITVCGSRLKREDVIRLHNLASCLASQHEKSSRAALSAYIHSADIARFQSIFASDSNCRPSGGLRVSPILLNGAFAEALLTVDPPRKGFQSTPLQALASSPQDGMMACLMSSGSAEAMKLVRTPLYSRREQAAVSTMTAKLRTCLPAGVQVRTNLAAFRAIIAINLFALSSRIETELTPTSIDFAQEAPPILPEPGADMPTKPLSLPALTIRFDHKDKKTDDPTRKIIHVDPNMPDETWVDKRIPQDSMSQTGPDAGESTAIVPDPAPQ